MNESQKRSVLFGLLDIHRRMAEMEAMLAQCTIDSPFSPFVNDLSPTESQVVRDYFGRIRTTMVASLREVGIPLESNSTSVRWSLQVGMPFLSIALAEMAPDRLRGYGFLDAAGEATVVKIQQDLRRLVDRLGAYLHQGLGRDFGERLARLEATPASVATLTLLDRVITRWQLVEFRPVLDSIVRRFEAPQLEIAVFGRVSSGKSSLLNHLAGRAVLPVGVTPITAVPTRLTRGNDTAAVISFAEREPRRIDVGQLSEYASEEGNPGNHKHVTNILVQLPSPRLREGVVLVDTPGIGSLALGGSAETLAYLPRCDLGVVLVDAASTLNQDDLTLLRALYEAGIPAQVLVSKADLLSPPDRERMAAYLREHLRRELGLDLRIQPVSTIGPDEALLTQWFEREIAPLWDRHRTLAEASLRRKTAHLRESVVAVLETLLAKERGVPVNGKRGADAKAAGQILNTADQTIRQTRNRLVDWTADQPALIEVILRDAARSIASLGGHATDTREGPLFQVIQDVLTQRSQMAYQFLRELQQTFVSTLEALRQTAPLAEADPAALRDLVFGGLPVPELSLLRGKCRVSRPWWGSFFPPGAVWRARRSLEKQLAPALRELVELYDRQLHAWLRGAAGQLIDQYEAQAEVFREQVRRLSTDRDGPGKSAEARVALTADIKDLQRGEGSMVEVDSVPSEP
jgi:GTP-binding protein EngB required for normal cell division